MSEKQKKAQVKESAEKKIAAKKGESDAAVDTPATSEAGKKSAPAKKEPDLKAQLQQAEAKVAENWELVLRGKAELENLRKRAQRDVENAHKFALEKIAAELLAVCDSMELGLSATQEKADVKNLREGAELTLKMLTQVMEKFEIKAVDPLNQRFNPDLHQAMTTQESDKVEPNTVVSVLQKGYTLSGRLLRPALVCVAKAPQVAAPDSSQEK